MKNAPPPAAVIRRLGPVAYWAVPPLFCLFVYWFGLKAWFQQDDFAWLQLRLGIHGWRDLVHALFAPMAQGTIRPWSERAFFLVLPAVFGIEALPFRICAFLTQCINLALVSWIARRLTCSRMAGFWAPVLWTANGVLAPAMSWTSAYNEILFAFFLLASFALLLRYIETGARRYYRAQLVVFLLGFGALELNVVYPALAAAYTLCCARKHFRGTLPLFVPAAIFAWLHQRAAPPASSGVYGMHFDASVFSTLCTYWQWALGPALLARAGPVWPWAAPAGTAVLSAALIGFAAWKFRSRNKLGIFLLAWFLIVIGPLLPLRDHVSDYYLTVPVIGLAILGGWGLSAAISARWGWKATGALLLAGYLACTVPAARAFTRWRFEQSRSVRNLVQGVIRAGQLHPDKIILLNGITSQLFWAGIFDRPFRAFGIDQVYLTPGSDSGIEAHPEFGAVSDFVLPANVALEALAQNRAAVYTAGGERLRNVTLIYKGIAASQWAPEAPMMVDAGQPLYARQLGAGWYTMEGAYRWMSKRATVRLHGPRNPEQKLFLSGFCPAALVKTAPVSMRVGVDGRAFPAVTLSQGDASFNLVFPLPAELTGKLEIEVSVEVDRAITLPPDNRELALAFGVFEVR